MPICTPSLSEVFLVRAVVQHQWHAVMVVNDAPFAIPRTIFSFIPGDKTLFLHGGVLNGCVYDRISSVIKKALQCVGVSKCGWTSVVTVSTRSMTLTTSSTHDKTFAGGTAKFSFLRPSSRVKSLGWSILVVSIEVTESATRGNSSYFALQIPRFLVLHICSTAPFCPSPLFYFFFRTRFFHKYVSFPDNTL